ncbi:hypothetical protein JCM21738_3886 [Mesobacillus boroniphilus JCM 21738]|uniref:Uncharacterized protein n=1 Tax=Mesobacillus boroniphilus JCM 21738 TaxID=1294265 RepID=W4RS89_9BACI|nr:hypothetical protein JCM21738_3886 [Mesobacillus boroniphilus JCM 21738]
MSYLIGCQRTGEAIVIDPARNIQPYLDIAKKEASIFQPQQKLIFTQTIFLVQGSLPTIMGPSFMYQTKVIKIGSINMSISMSMNC